MWIQVQTGNCLFRCMFPKQGRCDYWARVLSRRFNTLVFVADGNVRVARYENGKEISE